MPSGALQELAGQRVLVLGLGRSGQSAAAFLAQRGAEVLAADERAADALGALALPASVSLTLPLSTRVIQFTPPSLEATTASCAGSTSATLK